MALPLMYLLGKSGYQGAQTSVYGCLADDLKKSEYYADCALSPILSEQANDPEAAKKLW